MKRIIVVLVLAAVIATGSVAADTGVGVILGDPTGISALFGNRVAVAAAWSLNSYVHLHADLWLLNRPLVDPLSWYFGVGGTVQILGNEEDSDDLRLGARIPFGIQWYVLPRLELFAELAPGISVIPETDADIDGGIGLRYHF
ncbi:MAG TPA: hypothetical protein VJ932_08165 [Alkalispirochaeta sp.]|nr:hypothetical protein [Alkalispirochaeta sp.]